MDDERIYYAVNSGHGWSTPTPVPLANAVSSTGPVLAAYGTKLYGMWKGADGDQSLYFAVFENGTWTALANLPGDSGQDTASPPSGGLIGNATYFVHGNGAPLLGLTVTIDVTEDIVSRTPAGAPQGFSFQLNAYAPSYGARSAWQQYIFSVDVDGPDNTPLTGFIEVWPNHLANGSDLYQGRTPPIWGLTTTTIPAKTRMVLTLQNDAENRITGATFSVTNNTGGAIPPQALTFTNLVRDSSLSNPPTTPGYGPGQVDSRDESPIVAFQMNLVGPAFASGAGMITYAATTPLSVQASQPSATAAQNVVTAEKSNAVYSGMAPGPAQALTQTFVVAKDAAPM